MVYFVLRNVTNLGEHSIMFPSFESAYEYAKEHGGHIYKAMEIVDLSGNGEK